MEKQMTTNTFLSGLTAAFAITGMGSAHAADIAAGEKNFNKCLSCHAIVTETGETIVKGGRAGPNLHGVVGRVVGTADFRYGAAMKSLSATGLTWTEAELATFIADPPGWLIAKTGDPNAKTTMIFKLHKGGADIAAYLAAVGR